MGISEEELERASEILRSPSELRSKSDVLTLVDLTKSVKFFKSLSAPTHEDCCRLMRLRPAHDGECLFHFGDPGDSFCIILKGKVSVRVPESDPHNFRFSHSFLKPPRFTEVAVLSSGSSFGELSLLQNKPRAATILCLNPCLFAILDKIDFNKVLRDEEERKMKAKVEFLQGLSVFAGWSGGQLRKLCYYIRETTFRPYQVVYREGEKATDVYFLVEGEVVFTKKMKGRREKVLWVKKGRDIIGTEYLEAAERRLTCTVGAHPLTCYLISKFDYEKRIFDEQTKFSLNHIKSQEEEFIEKRMASLERAELYKWKPMVEVRKHKEKKRRKSIISQLRATMKHNHSRTVSSSIKLPMLIDASMTLSSSFSSVISSLSTSPRKANPPKVRLKPHNVTLQSFKGTYLDTSLGEAFPAVSFLTEPASVLHSTRLNGH